MPTAPTTPRPGPAEFLARFRVRFARREGPAAPERYRTGLLTEHPNTSRDALARLVPGTTGQRPQGRLTAMAWDADDLNRQPVGVMAARPTERDRVPAFDGTGSPEPGTATVGVARQYSRAVGTTGTGRVAVTGHYAERTPARPVAARPDRPRHGADDPGRRATAGGPGEVEFRTTPGIALDLLDRAKARGVRWACVTADGDYADDPNSLAGLAGLDERGERYAVAVRADVAVAAGRRAGAPPRRADARLEALPAGVWRSVRWREGSNGWVRGRFAAVRCRRVTADGERHVGWPVGEPEARGRGERRRFDRGNLGPPAALDAMAGYAHRRHRAEQFCEEGQGRLGWDRYQGRLWSGFGRHAVTVMPAYSFLVWQEWRRRWTRPRPGRVRPAFSPSPGPPAGAAAGGAPAGQRLAAGGSDPGVARPRRHSRLVPPDAEVTTQY